MVRGLILLPPAVSCSPGQPWCRRGCFSIPQAMPNMPALSPGLVCLYWIKEETSRKPELVRRCPYWHHPREAWRMLTLSALKVPMLSSERGIR